MFKLCLLKKTTPSWQNSCWNMISQLDLSVVSNIIVQLHRYNGNALRETSDSRWWIMDLYVKNHSRKSSSHSRKSKKKSIIVEKVEKRKEREKPILLLTISEPLTKPSNLPGLTASFSSCLQNCSRFLSRLLFTLFFSDSFKMQSNQVTPLLKTLRWMCFWESFVHFVVQHYILNTKQCALGTSVTPNSLNISWYLPSHHNFPITIYLVCMLFSLLKMTLPTHPSRLPLNISLSAKIP